jgi:hypothetical protein
MDEVQKPSKLKTNVYDKNLFLIQVDPTSAVQNADAY